MRDPTKLTLVLSNGVNLDIAESREELLATYDHQVDPAFDDEEIVMVTVVRRERGGWPHGTQPLFTKHRGSVDLSEAIAIIDKEPIPDDA